MSSRVDISNIHTISEKIVGEEFDILMNGHISSPASVINHLHENGHWRGHTLKNLETYEQYFRRKRNADGEYRHSGDMLLLTNLYFIHRILLPARSRQRRV